MTNKSHDRGLEPEAIKATAHEMRVRLVILLKKPVK